MISSGRSSELRVALTLLLFGVAATLGLASAQVPQCELVERVVVTAQGLPFGREEAPALADAIATALNQAITQTRGVYVSVSTELFDQFRSNLQGELDFSSDFREEIRNRFSGFVIGYTVEGQRVIYEGLVEVTVRADVCLDLRIALTIDADPIVRQGIQSTLVRDVRAAGWQVIQQAANVHRSERDLLEFTFDTGVTYLARGEAVSSVGSYGGFRNATVTLDVTLIDTRTMQVVHGFNDTVTAAGNSNAAALQSAGQALGAELARSWNQVFLRAEARQQATFTFSNVNRSGTRYTLQEIVEQVPTVLGVHRVDYDTRYREVRLEVEVAGDPCQVAREVTTYRRVMTTLEQCSSTRAHFRVSGD